MGGADFNAGSGVAVIASQHSEMTARLRKSTLFYLLDPGTKNPDRYIVFLFAGHRTGMAADTSILIDYKSIVFFTHSGLQGSIQ
jgi:hypothetical protein